jgi:hypothetical protein
VITDALRFQALNPCGVECRTEMLKLRFTHRRDLDAEIKRRYLMLKNAEHLYDEYSEKHARAILMYGKNSREVEGLNAKVLHYKILRTQRQRRLKEALRRRGKEV